MNMASERDRSVERHYRSLGVLAPGEPLEAFDIVDGRLDPRMSDYADREATRQKMIGRIEVADIITKEDRGFSFLERVDGGLRKYNFFNSEEQITRSPLRWFFVPALAFLAGAFGCAFISFRWR
jgi:hypothetical protein